MTTETQATGTTAPVLATWNIDPAHSSAEFGVKHMMISTVKGRFGTLSGTLQFDGSDMTMGSVEATIDVSTIDTNEPNRDGHLRSPDFFHVEQHPHMTFKSSKVERVEGDEYRITGDLTIRDVTKPVTLDVTYEGQITDPYGNLRVGYAAETTINRKEYGLTWGQMIENVGAVVGDKVKVNLHIEAVRQA